VVKVSLLSRSHIQNFGGWSGVFHGWILDSGFLKGVRRRRIGG
jgi:hypothetical protein